MSFSCHAQWAILLNRLAIPLVPDLNGLLHNYFLIHCWWCTYTAEPVPAGTPSRGGDVRVYVLVINQPSLPALLFRSCVCCCLYSPFNCISFHKCSRQLSAFSLLFFWSYFCLFGPFNYISLYDNLPQPWYNPLWLTGLKKQPLAS